jgi:hypothetical protein
MTDLDNSGGTDPLAHKDLPARRRFATIVQIATTIRIAVS